MVIESDINWGFRAHDAGKSDIRTLSAKISAMGFHNIQLALGKALQGLSGAYGTLSPGMGRLIERELRKNDISIAVLGCYINPVHPDREKRADHLNRFIEHLKYARDFGCSVVGTETGSPLPDCGFTGGIYSEENFQDFLSSLRILVDAAEKLGTIVAIEGVADKHSIHSHERMMRVLDLIPSPNLGIIYDPVNFLPFARAEESDRLMEEAFELFADRMVAIHAKDYILESDSVNTTVPSGRGLLNYGLLLKLIRKYKPMIPVLLENNRPDTIGGTMDFINKISIAGD